MKYKTKLKIPAARVVALLLALVCILPLAAPTSAHAAASSVDIAVIFDTAYYRDHNPDVVKVYGTSQRALLSHYKTYGQREGRRPSLVFDPSYYLSLYSDLRAAFGNDYRAALNHFLTHGIYEGRQGSQEFSVKIYMDNYSDLRQAFGTAPSDYWEYIQHYLTYGKNEGRNATSRIPSSSGDSSSSTTMYVALSKPGNRLNVRSGPSTNSSIIGKLSHGSAVTVLETTNGWSKIRCASGVSGYVSSQYLSSSAATSTSSSASARQKAMVAQAERMLGSRDYSGYCQRFVRVVGERIGLPSGNAASALAACNMWRVSTSMDNIPIGATVYLRSKNTSGAGYKYGHVGIYAGDGYVIHAVSTVKKQSLDSLLQSYTFLGWGWQSGVDLR